jgi:hypothetical protein
MNDYKYNSQTLIKVQQSAWYISLIYFAIVTFAYLFGWQFAEPMAVIGVIFIIAVTILKLFIMGQHFNKLRLRRFSLLSYLLVIVIIATVIWRFLK